MENNNDSNNSSEIFNEVNIHYPDPMMVRSKSQLQIKPTNLGSVKEEANEDIDLKEKEKTIKLPHRLNNFIEDEDIITADNKNIREIARRKSTSRSRPENMALVIEERDENDTRPALTHCLSSPRIKLFKDISEDATITTKPNLNQSLSSSFFGKNFEFDKIDEETTENLPEIETEKNIIQSSKIEPVLDLTDLNDEGYNHPKSVIEESITEEQNEDEDVKFEEELDKGNIGL